MPAKKKHSRADLDKAVRTVVARFGHRPNFTGADVGYRWTEGKRTDELCVRVHVERKLPQSEIEASDVFPPDIDGIPLDVIHGPYRPSLTAEGTGHRARFSHVMGGISCGRLGDGTGTIGAVVIDEQSGKPSILSNWHVMAGARARVGDEILQPGEIDSGVPGRDGIARLQRWMLDSDGDAATATLGAARSWLPVQFGTFAVFTGARNSRLGEVLVKSGRTTAQTQARVDGEGIYRLTYEVAPGRFEARDIRGFKLVPVKDGNPDGDELSSGGDSGSTWYNAGSGEAVGLHFAGETSPDPTAEHAIACNMPRVLERLNVRLATYGDLLAAGISAPDRVERQSPIGTGLTINPDWEDPRLPIPPIGWPWPQPWPGPWPWPWIDPRAIRNPSPLGSDPRFEGPAVPQPRRMPRFNDARRLRRRGERTGTTAVATAPERLNLIDDIWPRLQTALSGNPDFTSARLHDLLSDFMPEGDAQFAIAHALNNSGAFFDLWPGKFFGTDFDTAVSFAHVCGDIHRVIEENPA